jgi:uncharacterized membrane-anchored protein YhcB (DUF1043 family)
MTPTVGYVLVMLAVALVGGWLVGRFTGKAADAARDLAAQVEALRKESERSAAELAAAKVQIQRVRAELDEYRTRVSDHFTGTSDRFRDLSLQYRTLFDHLSEGARALCGGDFAALEGDLAASALPERAFAPAPSGAQSPGEAPAAEKTASSV